MRQIPPIHALAAQKEHLRDVEWLHDIVAKPSAKSANTLLQIMSAWDVLFGTIFRDVAVYDGIIHEKSSGIPRMGDAALDGALFFGCFGIAGIIGFLRVYCAKRDVKLQTRSDDYFIQKLLDLQNPNLDEFLDPTTDLKNALRYHGENVWLPVAGWRWFWSDFTSKELEQLALNKQRLVRKAVKKIYGKHKKQTRVRRLLLDRGFYQLMDEGPLLAEDQRNLSSGRTVIFERLQNTGTWRMYDKYSVTDLTPEQQGEMESRVSALPQAVAISDNPGNAARTELKNYLKTIKPKESRSALQILRSFTWETYTTAIVYMYGFWVTWYGLLAVTGIALSVGASLSILLISFGLPAIPAILYILGSLLFKDRVKQPKCLSNAEENRIIFIAEYKLKLDHDLARLQKKLNVENYNILDLNSEIIKNVLSKENLDLVSSVAEQNIASLKFYSRLLIPMSAVSGMFTGMIITGFFSWPVTSFLIIVCGATAVGGPVGLGIVFGLALFFGVALSLKMLLDRCAATQSMLEILEQKEQFSEGSLVEQLIQLEKENVCLEKEIAKKMAELDKPEISLIEIPQSIGTQDRIFRRMSTETDNVMTYLKKGLNRFFLMLQMAGTGILFPRLYFAPNSLFDVFTPMHFIFFASGMGVIWAVYKLIEYSVEHAYNRHLSMLSDIDNRIDTEKIKKEFLIKELNILNVAISQTTTNLLTDTESQTPPAHPAAF